MTFLPSTRRSSSQIDVESQKGVLDAVSKFFAGLHWRGYSSLVGTPVSSAGIDHAQLKRQSSERRKKSFLLAAIALLTSGALALFVQVRAPDASSPISERGLAMQTDVSAGRYTKSLRDILNTGTLPSPLFQYSEVEACPDIPLETPPQPVPRSLKYLMVIGTQKTGTTWLYEALTQNPAFATPIRRPGEDRQLDGNGLHDELLRKEPKFFNRWPLLDTATYLHSWDAEQLGNVISRFGKKKVLLDSSPQYLMVPSAAARVKAAVPQAKFVIVVRDPPMRTLSDHTMMKRLFPFCKTGSNRLCPTESFLKTISAELDSGKSVPECLFSSPEADGNTWHDCFKCGFNHIQIDTEPAKSACAKYDNATSTPSKNLLDHSQVRQRSLYKLTQPPQGFSCGVPHFRFIDQAKYAAQLAWWLHFFPPERFLLVSAWQLRDPQESLKVLNSILDHAEVPKKSRVQFTEKNVNLAKGFNGNYATSGDDQLALDLLREHFKQDQADLKALADLFWPHLNFTVHRES